MSITDIILFLLVGSAGALVKDIVVDGALVLPRITNGKLVLGFIGSTIVGAVVGLVVDHNLVMAFFSGYAGFSAISSLVPNIIGAETKKEIEKEKKEIEKLSKNIPRINKPFWRERRLTQGFGENPEWYKKNGFAGHFGLDHAVNYGESILACDDGIIIQNGFTAGNGNFVTIQHDWGISFSCHLKDRSEIGVGTEVARAQEIGKCGNTGAVRPRPTKADPYAGTHSHFSIKVNGIKNPAFKDWIDPTPFFI